MLAIVLLFLSALGPVTTIRLDGNGYTDILLVISPTVPENEDIINQIKEMIVNGSDYLFEALDQKVFFKEVKILVPPNWTTGKYDRATTETFDKGRIRIDDPHPAFGDDPYTHQTQGCGIEAEYIHFTPNFLLNNDLIKVYGPKERVFVHEWAHLRWGVFDEYNKKEPFYLSAGQIQPTRCTEEISGQWYEIINQSLRPCQTDAAGKPTSSCEFLPDAVQNTNASIMYMQSLDSVRAFCQEEEHNTEAPNEQNEKCSRKAARTVIFQDSVDKDFLHSLKPLTSTPPAPTFKLIQRGPRVVCLVLDVSGSMRALRGDDGKTTGDEIIFLTDGEATDKVQDCFQEAVQSGAIIHTISFGPNADNVLTSMADQTDGRFVTAEEFILSNQLVDAFSSMTISDGNSITQPIQLESTGKSVTDWFNGTVSVDRTVGNRTTFTLIYERRAPTVYIKSPSGLVYDQRNATDIDNTITFTVPGTAEPGDWQYSFLNRDTSAQQMGLTVMSRAAHEDVHPVTVTARMNQQTSDGTKPMLVLAEVRQKYNPVLEVSVWAYLESDAANSVELKLLDNGAAITSIYILYPGKVELNPPKPPVNVQPVDVGSFTRTVTGESFVVEANAASNFPPNKITDLTAEIQEDTVLLNWTAPGEDYDQGTAQSYEIRWSEDLQTLQNNFSSTNLLDTSALQPQESGSAEQHSFQPNITIKHGTTLFFAVQSMDQQTEKSEVSNIARATKIASSPNPSPRPPAISNPGLNLTAIIVSVCAVAIVASVLAVVITRALKRKRHH
ncbi:hypothetical protein PGIGA_G00051480 [Pangasianodon gigas]|uniref:Uncharacterized protein n=1 Tax=Pangasianodon gigas TaxID=30993 RepID=A0ACC5X3L7_PANGG|nr:hypothetical protein [Pangasianodon gigas]